MARPIKHVVLLSDEELKRLKSTIRRKTTSKTVRCRCQILIDRDQAHGKTFSYEQCAKSNGVCMATVSNTIKRYAEGGLDKALSYNRSTNSDQARRKLDGRAEAKVIAIACSPAPEGRGRWTLRLLEQKCRVELDEPVSKDTISRALKKTNSGLIKTSPGVYRQKKTPRS